MKRLLAYLCLFFGMGLVVNVNSQTDSLLGEIPKCSDKGITLKDISKSKTLSDLFKNNKKCQSPTGAKKIKIKSNDDLVKGKKSNSKKLIKKFKFKENENCEENLSNRILNLSKDKIKIEKYKKIQYCIKKSDIALLGTYKPFVNYPKGMIKEFGNGCSNETCRFKKASSKMYDIFVKKGDPYHAKYPGKMIHGMAWYELMYLAKLKKTQKVLNRYLEFYPDNYKDFSDSRDPFSTTIARSFPKLLIKEDEVKIHSLIKMNSGRKNMREAMGMSINDDIETVVRKHWVLGDFLNNDKLKVKKVVMDPDIKKRQLLLEKYQNALKRYKAKLEEERNKKKS